MPRSSNTSDSRTSLLEDLSRFAGGGVGESPTLRDKKELFRSHLPIPEHRRVLDRDVLLVLGGRGTGKSQLFRVLRNLDDPQRLTAGNSRVKPETQSDVYVPGYCAEGTEFPRREVIDHLKLDPADVPRFWLGLLWGGLLCARNLAESTKSVGATAWGTCLKSELPTPSKWLELLKDQQEDAYGLLDAVDKALTSRDQSAVIIYDDLDILAASVKQAYPLIRGLLDFWLRNVRRWRAIRCKIFLRTDIFDASELAFPDSSKLRPLSVALRWNADSLYRLVLKRLLNGGRSQEWLALLCKAIPKRMLASSQDPWGVVPATGEEEHKAFMRTMIGPYMGAEKRRGDTYQWFLNHLQDSRADIAPRSFLKLFEQAATRQLSRGLPDSDKLLVPEEVNGALGEVSNDRITELREEYSWIEDLAKCLKGRTVPVERKELRAWLRPLGRGGFPEHIAGDSDRLVDYLVSLGILRETADGRIHVPDIYLFGFGLKRKGGIRRPRV
ncbi:MAG: hypothetical protein KJ749_09795 [Planctomycetes bacterium]|nr:hypothetical protein [Planctomycetota bacterium]